jgi:hypothetical protein
VTIEKPEMTKRTKRKNELKVLGFNSLEKDNFCFNFEKTGSGLQTNAKTNFKEKSNREN